VVAGIVVSVGVIESCESEEKVKGGDSVGRTAGEGERLLKVVTMVALVLIELASIHQTDES
jgi:hypothetical protein